MGSSFTRMAVGLVLSGLVLAGCSDEAVQSRDQPTPTELRTDIEPIVGRVPTLGSDFTAQWFSNTTYNQRAPGPSTYWINALVTPADGVEALIDDQPLSPGDPDVREQLAELLPECGWEYSEEIDRAWGPIDWDTHVWFCQDSDQLVITMVGGA